MKKSDWDKLRNLVYAKENFSCHICGAKGIILDAHEVWEFDEKKHIQRLINIVGICKPCHGVIHYGRSQQMGFGNEAKKHFLDVTYLDEIDFQNMILEAGNKYQRLSKIKQWTLDVSFIKEHDYIVDKISK